MKDMPKKAKLPVYDICNLSPEPHLNGDIMIDNFAHYLDTHRDLYFPHKHSFYHLVYFANGSGKHSIDFVNFPVTEGQVYCMVPGQVHTWDFAGRTDGFIINFSGRFIPSLVTNARYLEQFAFFSGIADQQVIQVPKKNRPAVTQLLGHILREYEHQQEHSDDMMRSLMIQLFIELSRCQEPAKGINATAYNSVLLHNFQKLVDLHYKEKKLTKEYASLLYVTPNHLNALCKDVTGHSAGELIRNRVLLEAKRLLVNVDMTIAEIAAELDFADNSYFSKFFKKYEGVTPEAFRKRINKN